jgi:hypothetical protein
MNLRGILEPSLDDIDVLLWRRDAACRLLLECVQDVDNAGKRRGVNSPVGISPVRIGDLEHTGATKPLEGFRIRVLLPVLRQPQCVTENVLDLLRKTPQLIDAQAHEHELSLWQCCLLMPILAYPPIRAAASLPGYLRRYAKAMTVLHYAECVQASKR